MKPCSFPMSESSHEAYRQVFTRRGSSKHSVPEMYCKSWQTLPFIGSVWLSTTNSWRFLIEAEDRIRGKTEDFGQILGTISGFPFIKIAPDSADGWEIIENTLTAYWARVGRITSMDQWFFLFVLLFLWMNES